VSYFDTDLKELIGETISSIQISEDEITFALASGDIWRMHHVHECCEHVYLEDVVGDPERLIGDPVLHAYKATGEDPRGYDSAHWTFYRIFTVKGDVTLRWLGESNGYYSEEVSFEKLPKQ